MEYLRSLSASSARECSSRPPRASVLTKRKDIIWVNVRCETPDIVVIAADITDGYFEPSVSRDGVVDCLVNIPWANTSYTFTPIS